LRESCSRSKAELSEADVQILDRRILPVSNYLKQPLRDAYWAIVKECLT